MIDWSAAVTVFCVYVAAVVIPGPNFVAITHKAVTGRRADALAFVLSHASIATAYRRAKAWIDLTCGGP